MRQEEVACRTTIRHRIPSQTRGPNAFNWSIKPDDIRQMELLPLSRLILTKKDGSTVTFGLVDGGIVVDECNGLWSADTDRLKALWP